MQGYCNHFPGTSTTSFILPMSAEHLLRAEAHERGGRKLVVPQGADMEARCATPSNMPLPQGEKSLLAFPALSYFKMERRCLKNSIDPRQMGPVTLLLLDLGPWVQGDLAYHHHKGDGRNWAPTAQTLLKATPLRPRSRGSSCRAQTEPQCSPSDNTHH